MKIDPVQPPREFVVTDRGDTLAHVADVELGHDELVTFRTENTSFDFVRKSWG